MPGDSQWRPMLPLRRRFRVPVCGANPRSGHTPRVASQLPIGRIRLSFDDDCMKSVEIARECMNWFSHGRILINEEQRYRAVKNCASQPASLQIANRPTRNFDHHVARAVALDPSSPADGRCRSAQDHQSIATSAGCPLPCTNSGRIE